MSQSAFKRVREECKKFCRVKGIPDNKYPLLLSLAMKSYNNLSARDKGKWSLEDVVKQGL